MRVVGSVPMNVGGGPTAMGVRSTAEGIPQMTVAEGHGTGWGLGFCFVVKFF